MVNIPCKLTQINEQLLEHHDTNVPIYQFRYQLMIVYCLCLYKPVFREADLNSLLFGPCHFCKEPCQQTILPKKKEILHLKWYEY